jgi:hypothetical protein
MKNIKQTAIITGNAERSFVLFENDSVIHMFASACVHCDVEKSGESPGVKKRY